MKKTIKQEKDECEVAILKSIWDAQQRGFRVFVASDEECNSWNEIDGRTFFSNETNEHSIALAVRGNADEDEIFID